jgi:CBS domain containing-hemolysin-like protein
MYSLLIIFFLIALVFSFLCSLWEAVLLSITPSYAQVLINQGRATGRRLKKFKENLDRPLAAILSLNTAAHTIGAVGVGAQASVIWADSNPLVTAVVVPVIMTLGILVLSELIPKTIGANQWKKLVPFTVNSLGVVIAALYPLVWLGQWLTQWLKKDKSQSIFSHSEFLALAEIGVEEGHVGPSHPTIIGNLLSLEDTAVRDVMTPRPVVMAASEETAIETFYEANQNLPFSRIILTQEDDSDVVTGYFLKDTLLESMVHGRHREPLKNIRHDIITVPEFSELTGLFNRFIEKREHIALVVDEYGSMAGIATLEDIIETLMGTEILDETDHDADMRERARKEWEKHSRRHGIMNLGDQETDSQDAEKE